EPLFGFVGAGGQREPDRDPDCDHPFRLHANLRFVHRDLPAIKVPAPGESFDVPRGGWIRERSTFSDRRMGLVASDAWLTHLPICSSSGPSRAARPYRKT